MRFSGSPTQLTKEAAHRRVRCKCLDLASGLFTPSKISLEVICADQVSNHLFNSITTDLIDQNHVRGNEILPPQALPAITICKRLRFKAFSFLKLMT